MGRSGLPPLPLLAGLAALLLPEPVAEGRGWPGRRRGAGAAGGAAGVGARAWAGQRFGWGDPAGRPRLGGWGWGGAVCSLLDLGAPTPNFLSPGAPRVGWEGEEWGCVVSGGVCTRIFPPPCSQLFALPAQFWGPPSCPPHTPGSLSETAGAGAEHPGGTTSVQGL